jgi:Kdo2-lipid IVA lauroyltransferase/acyltransferase
LAKQKSKGQLWAEYALAATLIGLLQRLPRPAANALANTAAALLDKAVPKLRRVARINLAFALRDRVADHEHIINGVFHTIARLMVALARFPTLTRANIGDWIEYEGLENYLAAKREGKGVLVATAHLGNWELSAFAHALLTEPMHVMVRPLDNPLIDRIVERRRSASGNHLIEKKDGARAVLRALKANEAVGILIDQNTAISEGTFINFFGKQACASTAFAKLAHHSGAPVVPGFALWNETRQKYILRFYPPVPLSGNVLADTRTIHALFEQVIREHPDQWMWIHRRWKTRPPCEVPLY